MWIRALRDFVSPSLNIKAGNVSEVSFHEGVRIIDKGDGVEIDLVEALRQITGGNGKVNRIEETHKEKPAFNRKETRRKK